MKALGIHFQNKEFTARPAAWVDRSRGMEPRRIRFYRPTPASRARLARLLWSRRHAPLTACYKETPRHGHYVVYITEG